MKTISFFFIGYSYEKCVSHLVMHLKKVCKTSVCICVNFTPSTLDSNHSNSLCLLMGRFYFLKIRLGLQPCGKPLDFFYMYKKNIPFFALIWEDSISLTTRSGVGGCVISLETSSSSGFSVRRLVLKLHDHDSSPSRSREASLA